MKVIDFLVKYFSKFKMCKMAQTTLILENTFF